MKRVKSLIKAAQSLWVAVPLLLTGTTGCRHQKLTNQELIIGDWISLADTTYNVHFTKTKYRVNGTELFYHWPAPDSFVCYGEPFVHPGSGRKGRIIYFNKVKKLDADSLIYLSGFGQGRTEYAYIRSGSAVNMVFSRLKRMITMP